MTNTLITTLWLTLTLFLAYCWKVYGEQPYVSKFYYNLKNDEEDKNGKEIKEGKQWMFFLFLAGLGIPIIFITGKPLYIIAACCLMFVGAWPSYREEPFKIAHPIAAYGAGIFVLLALYFDPLYIEKIGDGWLRRLPLVSFFTISGTILLLKKYTIERIETAIFYIAVIFITILYFE